jgi:hypothetical protein
MKSPLRTFLKTVVKVSHLGSPDSYRDRRAAFLIFILLIGVFTKAGAQKNDYVWLSGYDSRHRGDSATMGYQFTITIKFQL